MRRRSNLDPAIAADLEQLDAVLAGEREDRELSLIADEVRASAPRMSPAFAEQLDAAAAQEFAGPEQAPRSRRSWRPPLGPALGLGVAGLIAVVVGVSATNNSNNDNASSGASTAAIERKDSGGLASGSGAASSAATAPQAQSESAAPAPSVAAPPQSDSAASGDATRQGAPSTSSGAEVDKTSSLGIDTSTAVPPPGAGPRRVQRAADLTISTPITKLQDTADGVTAVADRLGGYVYTSNVSANGDNGQATFDLRIPTNRIDEAMAALSRLGHVRSRTETSQDITARFSSALSRLQDARAERQALLRALAGATTQQEIDSIRARLSIARQRIVSAKNELFAARRASNLARIGVTVLGVNKDEGAATGGGGKSWTPGDALKDALHVLSVAASVAIVGLAGLIPAALLALLLVLAFRAQRKRRRELALDAHPGAAV